MARPSMYTVEVNNTTFTVPQRYTDLRAIGVGAQGMVCSAFDSQTKRHVAIKKLARPFQTEMHAKRAYREIKLMKAVNHRNIINLLNAFTPQTTINDFQDVYLVMERMEFDFSTVVELNLSHDQIASFLYQMLCGLKHIHSAGIIHRDLKPSNIVGNRDCSLKILDFGLARTTHTPFMTQYVVTRYYRAPEVILCTNYNESSDVWSVGCIMAEMILGHVLFRGTDHIDQWQKIAEILGTPSQAFVAKLPTSVRNFVVSLKTSEPKPFDEIFKNEYFPDDGSDASRSRTLMARDLLQRMLVIDPEQRISVDDALCHDYFNDLYDEAEVNAPPPVIDVHTIDEAERSTEQLKELIYQEIIEFGA